MVLDPEHRVHAVSHQFKYDSSIIFANLILLKQDVERKRAFKQAQGAANLHQKHWKQKDHLPRENTINKIEAQE